MKKYAILKNVHRGINFGVVVKSDGLNQFYGWSDKGIEWSDWANKNKLGLSDLPAGVSVGEFKNLSDEMSAKIVAGSLDLALASTTSGARGNRQLLLKSARYSNVSKYPEVTGKKIPKKQGNKKAVVSYKAKSFQQSVARSEIGLKVRTNELAFNYETKQFNPKPNRTSQMAERYAVQQKMSKGQERKFGAQIIKLINKDIVVKENIQIIKRDQIGQGTKEIVDFFVKGRLGYAIGRAARGAMPNRGRRSMRGMASRAITGVLDPRTRRDVDGDGMIFDGTWREMPDPTRFKPSAKPISRGLSSQTGKPFVPDPNKPIGSQSLQIIEDAKRREAEMSRIFEQASRGVQESIRKRGRGRGSRTAFVDKKKPRGLESSTGQSIEDAIGFMDSVNAGGADWDSGLRKAWEADGSDWSNSGNLISTVTAKLSALSQQDDFKKADPKNRQKLIKNLVDGVASDLAKDETERYPSDVLNALSEYINGVASGRDVNPVKVIAAFDPDGNKSSRANALEATVASALGKLGETSKDRQKYLDGRGRAARFGGLIDDITQMAEGAREPELQRALRKIAKGMSVSGDEQSELLETLQDMAENNETFQNDDRLAELIDDVKRMSSSAGDNDRQDIIKELQDAMRGTAEPQFARNLEKFASDKPLSDKERASLLESLNDVLDNNDLFENDRRLQELIEDVSSPKQKPTVGSLRRTLTDKKRRGLSSGTGGDDDDLGSDMSDAIDAITKLKEGKKLSADEVNAILTTVDNLDMTRIGDEDQRIAIMDLRNQARRQGVLKSSTSPGRGSGDDLGSDLDDAITAINKAKNGEKLTKDEIRAVLTMVDNIDMTRIDDEDDRIALMDLKNQVLKQSALSSSTTPRRRPVSQATSSRIATATTERASRPRGLGSTTTLPETRTEVEKSKPKPRRNIYFSQILKDGGVKKQDGDGVLWESMSEEDRTKTKEAIAAEKAKITKYLKTKPYKKWWQKATEEGLDKQSLRAVRQRVRGTGGRQKVRPKDDPLTKDDAREMMQMLDENIVSGKVNKFQINAETGEYVLDKQGRPQLSEEGRIQRLLEDLVTILNMEENDDFSLLEHFHTGTRTAISKAVGTPATKKFSSPGKDSSIFKQAGGLEKAASVDELNPEETGKKKKQALGKRLLRMNKARAARAQQKAQRAARRKGGFRKGRVLTTGDPALELKKARLRTRAMKRRMVSNFRRNRDADELAKDLGKIKAETSTVSVDNEGTIKIKPRFVDVMAKLDDELKGAKTANEKEQVYDQLLADLWENNGYSDLPTLLNEDEVRRLIDAGWQPVIRGTGHQQIESEGFVEQFLTNESARFIPGQGMRAYGVGEYFAYPGEWMSFSGNPMDRHSMLVLIPPSADIVTTGEMRREYDKMHDLTTRLVDAAKTLGGRDAAEKMSAGELAVEFRKAIPNLADETSRSGQIINQLVGRLEELDNDPGDTSQERRKILGAIDYLSRFTKQNADINFGYLAPIIGVDGIDTNNEPGAVKNPFLIHNRTGIAAYQIPVTRDEAERLAKASDGSKIGAVWHKWANRKDRSREGAEITKRSRIGRKRRPSTRRPDPDDDSTPSAPAPQEAPKVSKSAVNTDAWSRSTPQNVGSNPATMLTDPNGTKYYTKLKKPSETSAQAAERMETEVLAAKLYELAGVPTADLQMGTNNGEPVMLSRMIQTRMPNLASDKVEAQKGFVADAWLANWDAPLNDNIKIDNNGRAVRLDVGGSLDYRAQGAKKGSQGTTAFGNSVGEMTSLQKRGGNVDFSNMDKDVLKKQAQKLGTITDDDIRKTVQAIVSDPARAKVLADTLIARRDDIMKKYG